ncbi:bifunctional 5,10-methylenetetrahydrofolate dehydrogenase/5,10-methenyltetrahydrofolate cyclohydrolase [Pseudonocardia endophytica]|uniref:Bifunctional protein FolD n=1 Tax=Pseudonocardia endophytica TaxID=401976 RepID=A0A4R1HHR9_PSEEN|nr:bifunctional 5,10-methylenetetrahydrofolate dehydrogenase/5,10-methenyltetrahydrofolate cyclohydrolase [Pseudonocardia endophytica]TCK21308.1 methylenetetrahydrofolate dehydrogenase (NADP+)/methenyltetrahydrofolate cyclohydrolase [Pseudonocardia endophytica]
MSVFGDVELDLLTEGLEPPPRAELIDGRSVARRLRAEVRREIARLPDEAATCGLATVMVGVNEAAAVYERRLRALAGRLGIGYRHLWLADGCPTRDVARVVDQLNSDPSVHGILLLRPFPSGVSETDVFARLDPAKDIEAVHPENAGLLAMGTPRFEPSTPAAAFHMLDTWLDATGQDRARFYRGATIVVVGRSNNVGKPALALGHARGAIVVSCDEWASRTGNLAEVTLRADVLIVAAGVPNLIGPEHVADGAVLLDVGINPVTDPESGRTRMVGDIDLPAVLHHARAATPVPGGVGPVTDVWLMRNCVRAASLRAGGEGAACATTPGR